MRWPCPGGGVTITGLGPCSLGLREVPPGGVAAAEGRGGLCPSWELAEATLVPSGLW